MKRFLALATMLVAFTFCALAQSRDKSVFLEVMGPSNMLGISYDARIKRDSKLGYRIGLAYSSLDLVDIDDDQRFVSIPLGLNYLLGNGRHRLELGAGVCPGIFHHSDDITRYNEVGQPKAERVHESENLFGCVAYGIVGYRFTANNGLQLRCGFSPSFDFGNKYADNKLLPLYPSYISIGYAF